MEDDDKDKAGEPMSLVAKLLWAVGGLLFLLFVIHYAVKTFRNYDHRELSERFIRGNELIRDEAGEIVRLGGGQSRLSGLGEWEISRSVLGSKKKLAVTISMHCNQGSTDVGVGCTIQRVTYKGEASSDVEREVPVSWYDNFLIVYR
jgi:hypothetical protein